MRSGGNHSATIRSSGMNTMESPIPTRTRAAIPPANDSANASPSWATVMRVTPHSSIRLGPKRSSSAPTGICIAA
jgi:hypothetical protein